MSDMQKRDVHIPPVEWDDVPTGTSAPSPLPPLVQEGVEAVEHDASDPDRRGQRSRWSEEEEQKLKLLAEAAKKKKKLSWDQVAAQMPGRTAAACKTRYNNMKSKSKDFSKEKDGRICNAVAQVGSNCNSIEVLLPECSGKKIRQRCRELVKSGKIDPAQEPASSQEITVQDVPQGYPNAQPPGQENAQKDVPLPLVLAGAKREGFASRFLRAVSEWGKKAKWWRWK